VIHLRGGAHAVNNVVTRISKDSCFVAVTINGVSMYAKLIPSQQRALRVEQDEVPSYMVDGNEPSPDMTVTYHDAPKDQPSVGIVGAIAGAAKMAASHLGINATANEKVTQRTAICSSCPSNDLGRCSECGCYLWAKVRQANERCPVGKW